MPAINTKNAARTATKNSDRTPATPAVTNADIVDAAAEHARMQIANPFTAKAMDFAKAFSGEDINAFIEEDLDREDERTRSTLHFMIHLSNADKKNFGLLPRADAELGSNNPRYFKYEKIGKDGQTVTKDDGDIYTEISRDHDLALPILEELSEIEADKSIDPTSKINRKSTLNARLKRIKTLFVEAVQIRDMLNDINDLEGVEAYFQTDPQDGTVVATKTPMVIASTLANERTKVMPMAVSRFIGLEPEKAKESKAPYDILVGATQRDRAKKKNLYMPKSLNDFEVAVFAWQSFLAPLTQVPPDRQFETKLLARLKSKQHSGMLLALNEVQDHLSALLTDDTVASAYSKAVQEATDIEKKVA